MLFEQFTRQVNTANACILIDVAQNVGNLQCAARVMGNSDTVIRWIAENAHAQSADRARYPVHVQIKCFHGRGYDRIARIHFHPCNDIEKVIAAQ